MSTLVNIAADADADAEAYDDADDCDADDDAYVDDAYVDDADVYDAHLHQKCFPLSQNPAEEVEDVQGAQEYQKWEGHE